MRPDKNMWYLAQLKPNCAHIAKKNLARQEIPTFLPLEQWTRRHTGKFVTTKKPLFPGYLFVSLDTSQGLWRKVNSTYGITKIVGFGKTPTPVPEGLVTQLLNRCDREGTMQPQAALQTGERVRFTAGPFTDAIAEIERTTADQRYWVLMEIMGRQARIAAPIDQIAAVSL